MAFPEQNITIAIRHLWPMSEHVRQNSRYSTPLPFQTTGVYTYPHDFSLLFFINATNRLFRVIEHLVIFPLPNPHLSIIQPPEFYLNIACSAVVMNEGSYMSLFYPETIPPILLAIYFRHLTCKLSTQQLKQHYQSAFR